MQKDELFRRMDARLRRLDFAELWPGFRRYPCALYDREGVCLEGENLPPEKDWFANTAVCFRGKWTAIWNVEVDPPGEDMDLFTANLVHEMFHCYQYEMGESRWPDEREMLLYPMEEGNLRARRQELRLLARGAAEEDRAAFEAFREMRRLRKRLWPRAVEMESRAECVEGAAEYVGLKALEALAPAGAAAKITQYAQELAGAEEKLLDPRRTAYVSGCLLLKCAEKYAGEMDRSLHIEKPYFDLLPESEETAALLQTREEFLAGRQRRMEEFRASAGESLPVQAELCGLDPMNSFRQGDWILCGTLALLKKDSGEEIWLREPCLLEMEPGAASRVKGYRLKKTR